MSEPRTLKTIPEIVLVGVDGYVGGAEKVIESLVEIPGARLHLLRKTKSAKPFLQARSYGHFVTLLMSTDILHTHLFLPGVLGAVRKMFQPSLNWVHTVHYADYGALRLPRVMRWIDHKLVFPKASRLVFVSRNARDCHGVQRPSRVIENDVGFFKLRLPRLRPAGKLVLGCVSKLRSEKGLDDLIRALAELRSQGHDVNLHLMGEGPDEQALRDLAKKQGVEQAVRIFDAGCTVEDFLTTLDVYVQPSRTEAFGIAVLEAMSFSIPIITARVGNLPNLLAPTTDKRFGILVERSESFVRLLCEEVLAAWSDYDNWAQRAADGYRHWRGVFGVGQMREKYQSLYQELLRPGVAMISPIVTQSRGGLQKQLLLQSQELVRLGYRVWIVQNRDQSPNWLSEEWSHADFIQVPQLRRWPVRIQGVFFILAASYKLWRQRRHISICHAHQLFSPTVLGAVFKLLTGCPLVVKVTASGRLGEVNQLPRLPFWFLRKKCFSLIDQVLVLTPAMRSEVETLGISAEKISLVPNGVLVPKEPVPSLYLDGGAIHLVFIGRLSLEKSIPTILLAAKQLSREGLSVEIDLVGDFDLDRNPEAELRALANELNGRVPVHFWGRQDKVSQFLNERSIFILPSSSEGMSNSLLEAMAAGALCVVSDIEENRFLIKDFLNGRLFQQGNAASLAEVVQWVAADLRAGGANVERLKAEARKTIEQNFSVASVVARIVGIYNLVRLGSPANEKLRILRLFSRLNIGGPALHVVNLTQGLEGRGFATTLAVGQIVEGEGDMSYYAAQKGVAPKFIRGFQAPLSPLNDLRALVSLWRLAYRLKPQIIHTHTFKAGALGRIVGLLLRTPVIVHTYHGHLLAGYGKNWKSQIIAAFEGLLARWTDMLLTVSPQIAEDLVAAGVAGSEKFRVIELGFDLEKFYRESQAQPQVRKLIGAGPEDIVVGLAARLVPVKNVELFIQAIGPLMQDHPKLHAVIVGDGVEREKLEAMAKGVSSRIHFTGWLAPLAAEYKDLDLLISSSLNEGTSVTVIEAVLMGVPVISTRVGGMDDLLENGRCGDLVELDEKELRSKIESYVSIWESGRLAEIAKLEARVEESKRKFVARFGVDRLLGELSELYRELLMKKNITAPSINTAQPAAPEAVTYSYCESEYPAPSQKEQTSRY